MDPFYAHLIPVFVAEADGRLAEWQRALAAFERGAGTVEVAEAMHRAVHSLTGNAAMLGVSPLAGLARDAERVTQVLRTHPGRADAEAVRLLGHACDVVAGMIATAAAGGHPVGELEISERLAALAARLQAAVAGEAA